MTPQAYCARLEQALSSMPPAERQEIIRYYLEFLEDASEDERSHSLAEAMHLFPMNLLRLICSLQNSTSFLAQTA